MNKNVLLKAVMLLMMCIMGFNLTAQTKTDTTPEPYEENEFPQWALDLRRAEIITLGSMPFVTIGVTLVYGATLYFTGQISSFPNPFNKTSSAFSSDQSLQVFGISFGVSTILGLTDWLIMYHKRKSYDRMQSLLQSEKEKPSVQQVTPEEAHEILRQQMEKEKAEAEAEKAKAESEKSENGENVENNKNVDGTDSPDSNNAGNEGAGASQ